MEWRHFDQKADENKTILTKEYPQDWDRSKKPIILLMMRKIHFCLENTKKKQTLKKKLFLVDV